MSTEVSTLPETQEEATSLVRLAIDKGVDVAVLERIVALQERISDRNARMSFVQAMAKFQAEVGPVPKTHAITVDRNGTKQVRSRFAPLHVIAEHIREPLARNGLSYSWDSTVTAEMVEIRCTLRHIDGHQETASFTCKVADASAPGMSGVQVGGSARTYGERYSLVQALGLTTADEDTDGEEEPGAPVSEEQFNELAKLANEVKADLKKFCEFLGVESLREIPAARFGEAKNALEAKRKRAS